MALGTSIGGYRIIKAVGMDMVKLEKYQGFAADMAGAVCLLLSSLTGIPVSTTHTKTTAIMGVGASRRLSAVNWGVVKEMVLTWVLTFPGCGIIGYLFCKIIFIPLLKSPMPGSPDSIMQESSRPKGHQDYGSRLQI